MLAVQLKTTNADRLREVLRERIDNIDFTVTVRGIVRDLEKLHALYFDRQGGPEGAWQPLAPYTVRKKGHPTILEDTGRLRNSLASRTYDSVREVTHGSGRTHLRFGTKRPFASVHQYGKTYSVISTRRTITIPRRVHVGLTRSETKVIAQRVARDVVRQLLGKKPTPAPPVS